MTRAPATILLAIPIACSAHCVSPPTASAAAIGEATTVERTVSAAGGSRRKLTQGSEVEANETVATDGTGRAAFRFVDDTLLSIGPNASIKLESFVFDGETTAKSFAIKATKGMFRFVTGASNHDAYVIRTPTAVIGARGTEFDVSIKDGETSVSVSEGEVSLCRGSRLGAGDCHSARPGETILSNRLRVRVAPTASIRPLLRNRLLPLDRSLQRFGRANGEGPGGRDGPGGLRGGPGGNRPGEDRGDRPDGFGGEGRPHGGGDSGGLGHALPERLHERFPNGPGGRGPDGFGGHGPFGHRGGFGGGGGGPRRGR
jgi:hypothetical protein